MAEKNELSFSGSLTQSLTEVKDALPTDLNITRFVNNAVALLNGNEVLADFAKKHGTAQIKAGLMRGAYLGLDALNAECYLVPYGSTLNFMPSYKGDIKLCKKYSSRRIKDIYAKVVREGDEFTEKIVDGHPSIDFSPKPFNNGEIIGVFAVVLYEDGGMAYDTMSKADVENTRNQSKAKNSPAWSKFFAEMAKKTVLHRLCKHIDVDMDGALAAEWNSGLEIETDPQELMRRDVEENANSEPFVIDAEGEVIE